MKEYISDSRAFRNELLALRFDDELPAKIPREEYDRFCAAVRYVAAVLDRYTEWEAA